LELSLTLVKEFRREKTEGKNRGLKFRLLDITAVMVVGPDGHPNHYGHWSPENVTLADRVHWCLPGPADTWNELLLQMLKRERWRGSVWLRKKKCMLTHLSRFSHWQMAGRSLCVECEGTWF
jgi:hypothetical protein